MNYSLFVILLWSPFVLTAAWYILSRRSIARGRPVVLFDLGVFALILVILAVFWWCNTPEKPRWDDGDYAWIAEPFFAGFIAMPLFIAAYEIRQRFFRATDLTRR